MKNPISAAKDEVKEENRLFYFSREIYNKKLSSGRSILELSSYSDLPLWWTIDTLFYNFSLKSIIDNDDFFKFTNSPLKTFLITSKKVIMLNSAILHYFIMIYELIIKIIIKILNLFYNNNNNNNNNNLNKKPKILFISQDRQWQYNKNIQNNSIQKTDVFFHSLIKELKENDYNPIGIYPIMHHPVNSLKIYFQKLRFWDINHVPVNTYWSFKSFKKGLNSIKHFNNLYKQLEQDKIFTELCVYENKNIHEKILNELQNLFLILIPHLVKYIEIQREMIRIENPSAIIFLAEGFYWERTLLIAAKLEKIPTIAIQHGTIKKYHKSYIYTKNELYGDKSISCPIPDLTLVYGVKYKKLLTENSFYPKDKVIVTGQPRYDLINNSSKLYSKDEYKNKYRINSGKKIVLWTTECAALSDSENNKNFLTIFKTFKELKDVVLIIKLHPADVNKYKNIINEYMDKYKVNAIIPPKNSDTYEHIFNSDLVITKGSTTGLEAVAMEKPLIILNLSPYPDPVDHVKNGVALGVNRGSNLKPTIKYLLEDDSILKNNRKKFIQYNLYKIDGKSTERVVTEINKLLRCN
jgi:hypothetical protein